MTDRSDPNDLGSGGPEIIEAPNPLRDKVRISDSGDASALFDAADQAIAEQSMHFIDNIGEDYAGLRKAIETGIGDPAQRVDALKRIYGVAHNLKGQGKSFGYDMISKIGASLCDFLNKQAHDTGDRAMEIVKAHIDAVGVVVKYRLESDGGPLGRKLVARLQGLVAANSG
jgi:hypothetical protein